MPPHKRITREIILSAVLQITRERGFSAVNARSIASALNCSTRPLFSCYENMEELKKQFLDFAFDFYSRFVADYSSSKSVDPSLLFPLSYIAFAKRETFLFQLLFVEDMELNMRQAADFYREIGNLKKAQVFADTVGVSTETAKKIFLDLFFYAHGMAVLTASGKIDLDETLQVQMLCDLLKSLVASKK